MGCSTETKFLSWNFIYFHESEVGVEKGSKIFHIKPTKIAKDKLKWTSSIIGQVVGIKALYINMEKFAEQKWKPRGLMEVQRIESDLFVFRF